MSWIWEPDGNCSRRKLSHSPGIVCILYSSSFLCFRTASLNFSLLSTLLFVIDSFIYANNPAEIFPRGCYISIFYIQLSAFHLPTQFVLLLLFDCDIFKLPVIFNLKTGDIFIRKSKRGKDRLRYAIPSFAKNHISQALSGWSMWLFVGLFCNTPVFLPIF